MASCTAQSGRSTNRRWLRREEQLHHTDDGQDAGVLMLIIRLFPPAAGYGAPAAERRRASFKCVIPMALAPSVCPRPWTKYRHGRPHVRAGVNRNDEERGKQPRHFNPGVEKPVVDKNGLNHHRSAAEHFHINNKKPARNKETNRLKAVVLFIDRNRLYDADDKTDDAADKRADRGNKQSRTRRGATIPSDLQENTVFDPNNPSASCPFQEITGSGLRFSPDRLLCSVQAVSDSRDACSPPFTRTRAERQWHRPSCAHSLPL